MKDGSTDRFGMLADPTRQALLQLLRGKPQRVGDLAARLPVTGPAVSQHLKALQRAQLVREEWRGTSHYFSLDPAGFEAVRQYADAMWQDALDAFGRYVVQQQAARRPRSVRGRKKR
jgi:DNA-binding transcriptional ArsR family regulator